MLIFQFSYFNDFIKILLFASLEAKNKTSREVVSAWLASAACTPGSARAKDLLDRALGAWRGAAGAARDAAATARLEALGLPAMSKI